MPINKKVLSLEQKVLDIFESESRNSNTTKILLTNSLRNDLNIDSLYFVHIVVLIELELGIYIDENDFDKFSTVADVVNCVKQKHYQQRQQIVASLMRKKTNNR